MSVGRIAPPIGLPEYWPDHFATGKRFLCLCRRMEGSSQLQTLAMLRNILKISKIGKAIQMQLSVTSWSFPACSLDESWAVAQALGFQAMDVGLFHGPALNKAQVLGDPGGAASDLAARGIRAANLYWLFGAGLADRALTDPSARAANLADFAAVCRFAGTAGIPSVFVLPGVADARPKTEAIRESATSLRALMAIANDHGVTLTVEPHVGGVLGSPAETLSLLDQVPGVKLALDYAHFACMGFTQDDIDPLAPFAGHVHLRQARPGALQAKWGEGTLDFAAMVGALRQAGYDGWLAVEYVHQAYMNTLLDDVLTETIRMRDAMRALGIG
jgi:sugar phosphate isomerase/epimerase